MYILACVVYFKGPSFPIDALPFQLPKAIRVFYSAGLALAFLFLNFIGSKLLAHVKAFTEIGRNTLILCGTENIMKEVLAALVSLTGLKLEILHSLLHLSMRSCCCISPVGRCAIDSRPF